MEPVLRLLGITAAFALHIQVFARRLLLPNQSCLRAGCVNNHNFLILFLIEAIDSTNSVSFFMCLEIFEFSEQLSFISFKGVLNIKYSSHPYFITL